MSQELSIQEELEKIISNEIEVEGPFLELKSHFDKSDKEIQQYVVEVNQVLKYQVLDKVVNNKPQYKVFNDKEAIQNYFRYICFNVIAGFLNTKGGRLYIGVSDTANPLTGKRNIVGFNIKNDDLDKTKQKLYMSIENVFKDKNINKYINIDMINYNNDGKYICIISVEKLNDNDWPVIIGSYVDKKTLNGFYIRKDESTSKLSVEQIINEVQSKERKKNTYLPAVPFDWSEDNYLLLSTSLDGIYYSKIYDIEPCRLILHNKGWEKDGYSQLDPDYTSNKFVFSLTSDYKKLENSLIKYMGDTVKFCFDTLYENAILKENINNRKVLNVIGVGKTNSLDKYDEIIKKIEIINGSKLRKFWNLKLLKVTTTDKILYTLQPEDFGYFICDISYAQSYPLETPIEFKQRIKKDIESGFLEHPPENKFINNLPDPVWFGNEKFKNLHNLDGQRVKGNIIVFEDLNFITEIEIYKEWTEQELTDFENFVGEENIIRNKKRKVIH